jgi:hypothetical protein
MFPVESVENDTCTYEKLYDVEQQETKIVLVLRSVEFHCRHCSKNYYIDLTLVPAHDSDVFCVTCDMLLFHIDEDDFEKEIFANKNSKYVYFG